MRTATKGKTDSLIGQKVGNYVVRDKIGEGPVGTAYLCEHPMLGRWVVLKAFHEDLAVHTMVLEQILREAKAANELRHPNIVEITDFGALRLGRHSVVYFVMEYLEGESLAARIARVMLLPEEIRAIARQCCAALEAAHAAGILHLGLKPQNIFLTRRDGDASFVKILDFGVAAAVARASGKALLGTTAYMSPEQVAARGAVDARSDVFSVGAVLYEMATGSPPFPADPTAPRAPVRPCVLRPGLPQDLEAIVLHAIEVEPDRRFQSVAHLREALDNPAAHFDAYRSQTPAYAAHSGRTLSLTPEEMPQPTAPPPPPVEIADMRTMIAPVGAIPGPAPPAPEPLSMLRIPVAPPPEPAPSPPEAPPPRRRALAAVALSVTAIGVVAAVFLVSRSGPTEPPTPPTAPAATAAPAALPPTTPAAVAAPDAAPRVAEVTPPAPPESVAIRLVTEPAGATVVRNGRREGTTPLVLTVPKDAPAIPVGIALAGYEDVARDLVTDSSREVILVLREAPPPAAVEKPKPTPPPHKPKPKRKKPLI